MDFGLVSESLGANAAGLYKWNELKPPIYFTSTNTSNLFF